MAGRNTFGSINQQSPNTISWNFGSQNLPDICESEKFTLCGDKYEFNFFCWQPFPDNSQFLLRMSKDVSLQLDMHIKLIYKMESKNMRLNKLFKKSNKTDSMLPLTLFRRDGLREIICTFLNIQELDKRSVESGSTSTEDNQIEDTKTLNETQATVHYTEVIDSAKIRGNESAEDEQIEDTKNLTETQAKENSTEKIDPVKIRGLLALSGNLKNVFLDEEDSDVTINVGDQKYPVHKIIIRAQSPVFYAMLKHDMKEKREGFVNIQDCDPHIFKDFLQYLYTGKPNISSENVVELYQISDKYEVKELKMDCTDFISSNLNVDIICDVISLATKHCEHDLLSHATSFFMENAKDILTTVNWQTFVKENPIVANELFIKTFNNVSKK